MHIRATRAAKGIIRARTKVRQLGPKQLRQLPLNFKSKGTGVSAVEPQAGHAPPQGPYGGYGQVGPSPSKPITSACVLFFSSRLCRQHATCSRSARGPAGAAAERRPGLRHEPGLVRPCLLSYSKLESRHCNMARFLTTANSRLCISSWDSPVRCHGMGE